MKQGKTLCRRCRLAPPPFEKAVSFAPYDGRMREALHELKFERRRSTAVRLAAMLAGAIAQLEDEAPSEMLVVPVPLHRSRQRVRGFNQTRLLAVRALDLLARSHPRWKLTLAPQVLVRTRAAALNYNDVDGCRGRYLTVNPPLPYTLGMEVVGDAAATLKELLPLLTRNEDRSFLEQAQSGMREWWELMQERGTREDTPMRPQVPAWHLNQVLHEDAIICGDSGTVTTWAARQIRLRGHQRFSFSGTNCSMSAALPYAIGAAAAYPGRQIVAFTGDGSLTMNLGDFLTCV